LGLAATVAEEVILDTARAVEQRGFHSFWLNNPPGSDALRTLGSVATRSSEIWLGVGVIPLTHVRPKDIATHVQGHALPLDRFYLGIGSGAGPGGVSRVSEGIRELRAVLDAYIVVAAMGPRMCRLAGEQADGVLFNWLTSRYAGQSAALVREAAAKAGRPAPRLMAYVRMALGQEAITRLEREAANYEGMSHYARHFARMGVSARETAIAGSTPDEIQRGLSSWNGIVDEVVVRAITAHDTSDQLIDLVEAARP
jgi:alkanesulfonate monooxygenase SsuD/methylene tetrahydromethanopterin reductase-like flavin-dependent oxidoreductase (luciferase family)